MEALPTQAEGPSRLATLVHGAASGEVRLERHPFAGATLTGAGRVVVAEPRYLFVRELAPELARYGLPRVSSRGRGPFSARLLLDGAELCVDEIAASVDGVDVAGEVRVGLGGALAGKVALEVLEAYLRRSPVLAVPAAFAGRVVVPVEIGGTVREPKVRADVRGALEGLMTDSRVGEAVKGVIRRVARGGAGAVARAEVTPPPGSRRGATAPSARSARRRAWSERAA